MIREAQSKGLVVSSGPIQDVTITLVSLGEEVMKAARQIGAAQTSRKSCTRAGGDPAAEDGEGL